MKPLPDDRAAVDVRAGQRAADRFAGRAPPVAWVLFRLSWARGRERRTFGGCRSQDAAALVEQERIGAAGANVDAKGEPQE